MKTILFQRRNAWLSPRGISLGGLLVILALLLVGFRLFFPNIFSTVTAPALRAGAGFTSFATDVRASFAASATLMRERDTLRSENIALQNENIRLQAEVDDLGALLGTSPYAPPGLIASVIARPPQAPYDTLLIGSGQSSGVSVGMKALAAGGVPIGEVESVTSSSARITLYSSPGHALAAWVGKNRVPVTLTGQGGGAFAAMAPRSAGIGNDDIVYIGTGSLSPIGRVHATTTDLSSPSVTLLITPAINLFSIVWVKLVP